MAYSMIFAPVRIAESRTNLDDVAAKGTNEQSQSNDIRLPVTRKPRRISKAVEYLEAHR